MRTFTKLTPPILCTLFLGWPPLSIAAAPDGSALPLEPVENFALHDHEGKFHEFDYYRQMDGVKGVVLFIQGNGCPLVQKRVPELKRLRDEYQQKGILFAMLNANIQDERPEIFQEAEDFGIDMPVLKDGSQLVAEMLGVARTAEAFLIDTAARQVVFRGAIDDRMSYQKEKPEADEDYLVDAIGALLAGEEISPRQTEAPGCKVSMDEREEVSYAGEVAPILKDRCVTCHTKGGLGPFAMSSYKKVRGWSDMIKEVILTKRMPPWHADPEVGTFKNDCGLSPEETRTLVKWIDADSPRGEGPDPLEGFRIELPEWSLGEPDKVIDLPEQKIAAEGVFKYRYVTLDNPFGQDVWLTASEISPGNNRVLHHVIVTANNPEERREEKWITGYAPGTQGSIFPDSSAVMIPKNWQLKFQLHYTASGREETDLTRLGLHFTTEPAAKEFKTAVIMNTKFAIPAGEREHPSEKSIEIKTDSVLYSLNPHMHFRGKRMSFEAVFPDGRRMMLLSVPNYNFNWQRSYVLEEPLKLPAGTTVHIRNAWDNSVLNPHNPDPSIEVRWGEQSFEEMFFATLGYIETS